MAERVSWAVSHSPGVITTTDARHSLGSLLTPGATATGKRNGRLPQVGLGAFNVTATGTPDGFVHVAPGHMWAMGTRSVAPYIQTLDAIKDINVLATPAHATLTRWDLIVAQQNDELHGDADNTWTIKVVAGTPAGSPVDPTVTGSPDYVLLARVVVGPAVTSITNGVITQLLTVHTVALGGVLPVLNQAERDALTGVYDGATVWRRDRDWFEAYDGAAWKVQGVAICSSTADRDSVITSPTNGQQAVTTDTGLVWMRLAGAWVVVGGSMVSDIQNPAGSTTSNAYVSALTGAGSAACGVVFVAPPSGSVLVLNNCQLSPTAGNGFCTIRVRVGAVIGAGADVVVALDDNAVITNVAGVVDRKGVSTPVTLLTPGVSYNVQQFFKLDMAGTLNTTRKTLIVTPQ